MSTRLTEKEKVLVLLGLRLGADWEETLAQSLGDGEADYRSETLENAAELRRIRLKLRKGWGFAEGVGKESSE